MVWAGYAKPQWINDDCLDAPQLLEEYYTRKKRGQAEQEKKLRSQTENFDDLIETLDKLRIKWAGRIPSGAAF